MLGRIRNVGITRKLAVSLLIVVLLFVATVGGVEIFLDQQDRGEHVVNLAGRQRLLLQEMETETVRIAAGQEGRRDDLLAAAEEYNRTLTTLRYGNESREIPPAPPSVQPQLRNVETAWRPLYEQVTVVATAPVGSPAFDEANHYVQTHLDDVLAQSNRAVTLYAWAYEAKTEALRQFLLVMLVLDTTAVVGIWWFSYRDLLYPIMELSTDARRITDGDLDHDIARLDRDDEIGVLTGAVAEMKDSLAASILNVRGFHSAVEQAGTVIFFVDPDCTIEYVNPAFEAATGYEAAEVVGADLRDVLSTEDDRLSSNIREVFASGTIEERELRVQRKDGRFYHWELTASPIIDDGTLERVVGIAVDVTQRKRREQQLQVFNRILRHNLRNSVNVINGYAAHVRHLAESSSDPEAMSDLAFEVDVVTARRTDGDGTCEELARTIASVGAEIADTNRQISRAAAVIEKTGHELVDLGEKASTLQREFQQTKSRPHTMALDVVLDQCRRSVLDANPSASITIETPDRPVLVDPPAKTAIREVIENAVVHNDRDEPAVDVIAVVDERSPTRVMIRVEDEGPGIPDDEHTVLERGEESALVHGSGLGLWLVHWVVSVLGGEVTIAANSPRGTVVTLVLPVATERRRNIDTPMTDL